MTFGLQIQMMLVAPAAVKRSWTCRQARANSPGWLPLACSDHGYQKPFISWSKRRPNGRPSRLAAAAHRSM